VQIFVETWLLLTKWRPHTYSILSIRHVAYKCATMASPSRTTQPSTLQPPTRCKATAPKSKAKALILFRPRSRLFSPPPFPLLLLLLLLQLLGITVHGEPYAGSFGSSAVASGGLGSVGIHIPGGGVGVITEARCPRVCSCSGLTVDCSHRGLTQVPRKISADVERL